MKRGLKHLLVGVVVTLALACNAYNHTDSLCSQAYPLYKSTHEVQLTVGLNEASLIFEGVCQINGHSFTDDQLLTTIEDNTYYSNY